MLYVVNRNKLRTSFAGEVDGDRIFIGSALLSYWKLSYREYRCNRYFLRRTISNNFDLPVKVTRKRKFEFFHPCQITWSSAVDEIVATNVSTIGQTAFELAGRDCTGTILSSEDQVQLCLNGSYDQRMALAILGELVFLRMDAYDSNGCGE